MTPLLLLALLAQSDTPPVPPPEPEPVVATPFTRTPARSLDEAKQDPRFVKLALQDDARVRVTRLLEGFPYYGIPNNGCSAGKFFLGAELLAPFDELPAGTQVVLRIEDASIGPAKAGAALAFSSLRRAGKGPDGTPVYCGRGTAFQIRQ